MSSRIRYMAGSSDTNYSFMSQRVFSVGGMEYRVFLYPAEEQFVVADATTGDSVVSGKGGSMLSLKRKAKKALETLGVTFEEENRTKSTPTA